MQLLEGDRWAAPSRANARQSYFAAGEMSVRFEPTRDRLAGPLQNAADRRSLKIRRTYRSNQ
jgi:hypothetical protein